MKVELSDVDELYEFRKSILRPNESSLKNVYYDGDLREDTLHVKISVNKKIIGCLSMMRENFPKKDYKNSYRIRALAVDEEYRKQGLANKMIFFLLNKIEDEDFLFWGSMRIKHIKSCKNLGFTVLEDEIFNIEGTGLHVYYYGIKNKDLKQS